MWTTERTARCGVAQREKERVGAGCGKSPAHVQLSAHSTRTRTRMVTATAIASRPSRISLLIPVFHPTFRQLAGAIQAMRIEDDELVCTVIADTPSAKLVMT